MPSDGDSPTAYAALGRGGLDRPALARARSAGAGLTALHTVACEERFGYHWLPLSGYLLSVKTIGNALLRFAPPELQERLLPEIAAGRLLFCQGFSEPDAGSDLASLRTRARRDGDRFVVSGRKIWTSSADVADWVYLAVRTDPERERHRGISVLVAPLDTPGITVRAHATLGGGTIGEVELDEVEIPRDAARRRAARRLVGADGHARPRARDEREGRRVLWLLDALGAARRADASGASACCGCAARPQAARLHGRRAAELLDAGPPGERAELDGQAVVAELMQRRRGGSRVELLGPAALLEEGTGTLHGRVAAFHRAAVATTISGGAAEVQRARDRPPGARVPGVSAAAPARRAAGARVRAVRRGPVRRHAARRPRARTWSRSSRRPATPGAATSRSPPARAATSTR